MGDRFGIDLSSMEKFRQRMQNLPEVLVQKVDAELAAGAYDIAAEAIQRAPGDVGFLRQGIGAEKNGPLNYTVFSRVLYSAYVEFGTRANVDIPPGLEEFAAQYIGSVGATALGAKEAIFAWCARKGIDQKAWYAIYISLMVNGVTPKPFFFPALNRQAPLIYNRVIKTLTEDVFK